MKSINLALLFTCLGGLGFGQVAHAADQTTANSNAYANFTEYVGPDGQYKLHIDSVSNIEFGHLAIDGDRVVYDAQFNENPKDGSLSSSTIVTVDNRGTNLGWELKVSNTQFSSGANQTLVGAKLSIHSAKSIPVDNDTSKLAPSILTPSTVQLNDGTEDQAFVLDGSNTLGTLLVAQKEERDATGVITDGKVGEGVGKWSTSFGEVPTDATTDTKNTAIKLEVPGNSKKMENQVYTSTLTWELSDAP